MFYLHVTWRHPEQLHAIVSAVVDPGFPVSGGMDLVGGSWTPEVVSFRKFCMSKRKSVDPRGASAGHAPLDPPMISLEQW